MRELSINTARNKLIDLPISHCANQHGTPRSGKWNDWWCYPIAYGKYGINYCKTDVSIASEIWVIGSYTIEDGFLEELNNFFLFVSCGSDVWEMDKLNI